MNIVIYARYSSRSQTEQSIEGQLQICYEFAKNNGHTVIGEYIDRAQSGTTDSRAEFQRMISDSDKHSFEGVLVYQLVMIKITALQRQADWLSQQLRLTRAQRFGAPSERTQALSERFALFNETEAVALPDAAEPDLEQITYKRKKRKDKRETDFSSLPTEQVIHELPEEERICPERGGSLRECGHAVLGRELLANKILHADETSLMVLQGPGRTARQGQAGWADERFSGRAAGVVQQPGGAFCAALCIGAENRLFSNTPLRDFEIPKKEKGETIGTLSAQPKISRLFHLYGSG